MPQKKQAWVFYSVLGKAIQSKTQIITKQSKTSGVYWIIFFKNHTDLDIKKATLPGGFFLVNQQLFCKTDDLHAEMFYLALSYFLRGLPLKYRRRWCVSQPSSRWIGVVPHRHEHQDNMNLENCIENYINKNNKLSLFGQALGLLVLLRCTCYQAST